MSGTDYLANYPGVYYFESGIFKYKYKIYSIYSPEAERRLDIIEELIGIPTHCRRFNNYIGYRWHPPGMDNVMRWENEEER